MNVQFFDDPSMKPLPRDEMKITHLVALPYPDRFRVKVEVNVTPFQERPNILLLAKRLDGTVVAELDVIATMHTQMEFTLHIRNVDDPAGNYTLEAELFYDSRNPPQDHSICKFEILPAELDTQ